MTKKILPEANIFSRSKRVFQIFLLAYGFLRQRAAQAGNSSLSAEEKERQLAAWAKEQFIRLGPTFIKLGQIISTRADLFPRIWVEEFSTLQDKVDSFSFDEAKAVIEDELGAPLGELFLTIDQEPISTASLGQVHRARRRIGQEIVELVVKVQRPGVEELVRLDLSVLRSIVQHLFFFPRFTKEADLFGFLNELETTFFAELDYKIEAANTEEFRQMFPQDDASSGVIIPWIDYERSRKRVLTLQYMPGTKISKFTGSNEDVQEAAAILIKAFLKQFVTVGVFHADPHPGNIAVTKIDGKVKVIFYDFGMVGRLSAGLRDSILLIAGNAIKGDAKGLVEECVRAGILSSSALEDQDVLGVFQRFTGNLDKVSAETIGVLQQQLFKASESGSVAFPRELTLVGRSLISIEGNLKALQTVYPELNLGSVISGETTALASRLLGEPLDPLERIQYDSEKLKRLGITLLKKGRALFDQIERGELQIAVKDVGTASAVRKLRFGAKSISAAILFATFFIPGILLLEMRRDFLAGLPLLAISIIFLERWYLAEKRLDN